MDRMFSWLEKKFGDWKNKAIEKKNLIKVYNQKLESNAQVINDAISSAKKNSTKIEVSELNFNEKSETIEINKSEKNLSGDALEELVGKNGLLNSKVSKKINEFNKPDNISLIDYVGSAIMRKILDDKKLYKMYSKKIPFEQWGEASFQAGFGSAINLGLAGSKIRSMLYKKFDLKSCLAILGPLSNNNKSKSIQKIKKFVSNELQKIENKMESFHVKNRNGQEIQTTYDEFNKYSKYYGTVLPLSLYFVANGTGDPKLVARIKIAINGLSGDNGKYGTNDLKTTVKDLKAVETDTVEAYAKKLDEKAKEFFKS